MRRRHVATPRLEPMEDWVVPSALSIHVSPSVSAQLHKVGANLRSAATSVQNELNRLIQKRTGQPSHAQWQIHQSHAHKASKTLFGIPWLKI
jgi:hypothetical protein